MPLVEERRIALAHSTLAAKCWGDPGLPPLLALHGWLDNAGSFDFLAPLLSVDRHVVALDLRGHGRSSHIGEGAWYHYVDYFHEIRATLDHFGWARADLLGHSLGGTLASLFAAAYPSRIDRLLLVEALGPLTGTPDDSLAQLRRSVDQQSDFALRRPLKIHRDMDAAIAARVSASGLSERAARALVERGTVEVDEGLIWSSDPRLTLASAQRFTEAQILAMLDGLLAPTLLVLATPATSYLPRAMIDARAARVASIGIVELPGNHHLHLENAGAVAEVMLAFLRTHPAG